MVLYIHMYAYICIYNSIHFKYILFKSSINPMKYLLLQSSIINQEKPICVKSHSWYAADQDWNLDWLALWTVNCTSELHVEMWNLIFFSCIVFLPVLSVSLCSYTSIYSHVDILRNLLSLWCNETKKVKK